MVSERADTAVHSKIDGGTAWAYTAVRAFARFTGQVEGGDIGTVISNLICELHRLANAEGLDWGEVVAGGELGHYAASSGRRPRN